MSYSTRGILTAAAFLLTAGTACEVDPIGLGSLPDGSSGGASGTPVCPVGIVEQASWPARTSATSCLRPCGPDEIGVQTCRQVARAECQKRSGCLCLQDPCVTCEGCTFVMPSECYDPINSAAAPPCPTGVSQGEACGPACERRLCLRSDGKSACVCNRRGQYACADWDGAGWQ